MQLTVKQFDGTCALRIWRLKTVLETVQAAYRRWCLGRRLQAQQQRVSGYEAGNMVFVTMITGAQCIGKWYVLHADEKSSISQTD